MSNQDPFHSGKKLAWLESVARDQGASHFDVRVAIALSARASVDRVVRKTSQERLAIFVGSSVRGIQKALGRLHQLGHISLPQRSNGRGHTTEYRLETPNGETTNSETPNEETTNSEAEKDERQSAKPRTAVRPLPISNPINVLPPAGACTDASANWRTQLPQHTELFDLLPDDIGSLERCWLAIKERLAASEHFGKDRVEAWLGESRVGEIEVDKLILIEPSRFRARHNADNYSAVILAEWRKIDPHIRGVVFRVLKPAVAADPTVRPCEKMVPLRERLKARTVGAGKSGL